MNGLTKEEDEKAKVKEIKKEIKQEEKKYDEKLK